MDPGWRATTDLQGRLAWVREKHLGIDSIRAMARWWEELPEASRPTGADHSSVGRYEAGKRQPPWDYVKALGARANVDPFWILSGEGTPNGPLPGPGYKDGVLDALEIFLGAWEEAEELLATSGSTYAPDAGASALRAAFEEMQRRRTGGSGESVG